MFSFLRKPLFKEIILLSVLVALLHYTALVYFLYWNIEWFDIIMHFLGGSVIGLIALFTYYTSGYVKFPKEHFATVFAMTIGTVLVVGLLWELWELFMGFSNVFEDQTDTVIDIIMDTLGGITAVYYAKKHIWPKN